MSLTAYCFASGHIQFGLKVPAGAIGIAIGEQEVLFEIIQATAELSRHDNETLFVPGVVGGPTEALAEAQALSAVTRYVLRLATRNQPGFKALSGLRL